MFRIVQFMVHRSSLEERSEEELKTLYAYSDFELGGECYFSVVMATTSERYFLVENQLRAMFGDMNRWLVRDMSAEYRLYRTQAPQSYDYGYVIEIGKMPGMFGEERIVAIPVERIDVQVGRYSSGMYTPVLCS